MVVVQERLQMMMAVLGGLWDCASFSSEGAVLCLFGLFLSFSHLRFAIRTFVWCGFGTKQYVLPVVVESQISRRPGLNTLHSRGGRPLQAYER